MFIPGHGLENTRYPLVPRGHTFPYSSRISESIPTDGKVTEPGFSLTLLSPGVGVNMCPPVSVYQKVSEIGHLSFPMTLEYHL